MHGASRFDRSFCVQERNRRYGRRGTRRLFPTRRTSHAHVFRSTDGT
jgi:hypothetical protein